MNYPNEETFENSKSNNQGNSKPERAEDDYKEQRILNLNFKKVNSTEHFQKYSITITIAAK